jgi:hypothetical protein
LLGRKEKFLEGTSGVHTYKASAKVSISIILPAVIPLVDFIGEALLSFHHWKLRQSHVSLPPLLLFLFYFF